MEPILATGEAVSPTASREPQIEQHTLLTSLVLHLFPLVLPEICLVYWKRNIKISILLHCAGNTIGALLSLVLLFMAK